MASVNPAPAISVAARGCYRKLGSTLEKFISTNNPLGKLRGENDRGYLTNFSVNTSQCEKNQSSDDIE